MWCPKPPELKVLTTFNSTPACPGGGRMSGLASQQDGGQFEDALRRLHALEKKLTDQVT